jgi:small subunit ribosomal protein S4
MRKYGVQGFGAIDEHRVGFAAVDQEHLGVELPLAEKVKSQTPHIINRETHNERDVPGWMQVFPDRGRILIHQLPVREQIVVDVSEQLIVELYSK